MSRIGIDWICNFSDKEPNWFVFEKLDTIGSILNFFIALRSFQAFNFQNFLNSPVRISCKVFICYWQYRRPLRQEFTRNILNPEMRHHIYIVENLPPSIFRVISPLRKNSVLAFGIQLAFINTALTGLHLIEMLRGQVSSQDNIDGLSIHKYSENDSDPKSRNSDSGTRRQL